MISISYEEIYVDIITKMEAESMQYSFEKRYEKKLSTLKAYAEVIKLLTNNL
jgi:hypothetical protein